jgi:hypothetical protein
LERFAQASSTAKKDSSSYRGIPPCNCEHWYLENKEGEGQSLEEMNRSSEHNCLSTGMGVWGSISTVLGECR